MSEQRTHPVDVEEQFPAIECIDSESVRLDTATALRRHTPEYFFRAPAASSYRHHNPYCCGERGLWIHTLMVATAFERMAPSWVEQGHITDYEADLGRAACLLHDLRKYGSAYDGEEKAARDHDLQMGEIIRDETSLDSRVAHVVASHMGAWYEGPQPKTALQQAVHQADMVAASKNITIGIYNAPDEIRELYPSLPGADL